MSTVQQELEPVNYNGECRTDDLTSPKSKLSLGAILDSNQDDHLVEMDRMVEDQDENIEITIPDGYCVECGDQPAELLCEFCTDKFCTVCYSALHRRGTRKSHISVTLLNSSSNVTRNGHAISEAADGAKAGVLPQDEIELDNTDIAQPLSSTQNYSTNYFLERSKYIPVRLTLLERKYLRLLEAALQVSEYTDKIDTIGHGLSKAKRVVNQIRELCAILSGLLLAADYKEGQELFADRDFEANADFYQRIFELGRRHKIMNPDKMRSTYGKLIYLLQDSQAPEVRNLLNFSCVRPIKTVYLLLEEHNALGILDDELIALATKEIYSEGRPRREIQKEIKTKEHAIEDLATRYHRPGLSQETIRQCIYSIGDNHAFLRTNRDPCDQMIGYLKKYFHPTRPKDNKSSLTIRSGKDGARLSHEHSKQYAYVIQSLTLWREILFDMFHLWSLAEQDLLSTDVSYRLRDTGQGLNRVQPAPKTSRMMYSVLHRAQTSLGTWVGSSVVHMGDHNVPNALMFIDKYSQIYRILLPISNTLSQIPKLMQKPAVCSYINNEYGSVDNLYLEILGDFFRHAFDGSGADNFFDAGSCIDGRLTSAWNWCASLEKKRYYHIFLLTGFVGFDGEW